MVPDKIPVCLKGKTYWEELRFEDRSFSSHFEGSGVLDLGVTGLC